MRRGIRATSRCSCRHSSSTTGSVRFSRARVSRIWLSSGSRREPCGDRLVQVLGVLLRQFQRRRRGAGFLRGIVLPLGISFITFQKIAYLVDIWRGHPKAASFGRFAFFVLFFPQLIAGPIVLFRNLDRQVGRGPRPESRYRSMIVPRPVSCSPSACSRKWSSRIASATSPTRSSYSRRGADNAARGRVGRRADLQSAALFRLLRLLRHGDRPRAGCLASGCRPISIRRIRRDHHRLLAALAHDVVVVLPRLRLYSARRQPRAPRCRRCSSVVCSFSPVCGTAPDGPSSSGAAFTGCSCSPIT